MFETNHNVVDGNKAMCRVYFMAGNTWHGNTLSISHMYIPRIKVQVSVWPDHVNESQLVLADLENNNASNI